MRYLKYALGLMLLAALISCGGGGGSAGTCANCPSNGGGTVASVGSVIVTSSPSSISATIAGSSDIGVLVLDSSNAAMAGVTVSFSASGGSLSGSSLTTDDNGRGTVTFFAGGTDPSTRVANIVATSGAKVGSAQVQVVGGAVTTSYTGGSLVVGGTATLTATVRDAAGNALSGYAVTFSSTDATVLSVSSGSVVTNASGTATVIVTANGAGSATVNAAALGTTSAQNIAVTAAGAGFYFTAPVNNSVLTVGNTTTVSMQANGASSVTFSATGGTFSNGSTSQTVVVSSNAASVVYTASSAGTIGIQGYDPSAPSTRNAALSLLVSPQSADRLTLNASRTNVPVSFGSTQATAILTARAVDTTHSNAGVNNVAVQFTMAGGPNGGEYLSPAVAFTDSTGSASTTFYAGTQVSSPSGITISAKIVGTSVATGVSPSGNPVVLKVGGQAVSVSFGQSTVISESNTSTVYILAHSVQVTDASGNGLANVPISLSVRPYSFLLGTSCVATFEYLSEDANNSGSLDSGEDGTRISPSGTVSAGGSLDGVLTPAPSDAGSVPSSVTTDSTGVATFNLVYLKSRSLWVRVKLAATVSSAGTESSSSLTFILPASKTDYDPTVPTCQIPDSPYTF